MRQTPSRPPAWAEAVAQLIAPAPAALALWLLAPFSGPPESEAAWLAREAQVLAAVCAYPLAVFVGTPIYLVMRRFGALSLAGCALMGAFVATSALIPAAWAEIAEPSPEGWRDLARGAMGFAACGAVGGAAFWLILRAGRPKDKARTQARASPKSSAESRLRAARNSPKPRRPRPEAPDSPEP